MNAPQEGAESILDHAIRRLPGADAVFYRLQITPNPKRPPMSIYAIPQVKANAIAATVKHNTAESANPYPADSPAGIVFIRTFNKERQRQEDAITAAEKPSTDAISTAAAQDIAAHLTTEALQAA